MVTQGVFEYRSGTQSLPRQKAKEPESPGEEALALAFPADVKQDEVPPT